MLAALGALFLLSGGGLTWILLRISLTARPGERGAAAAATLLLAAVGAYGAWLLVRGVRGWSRATVLDRASNAVDRELRDKSGLGLFVFLLFTGLLSHGRTFGSAIEWTGWSLLFAMLALTISIAAHEIGHLVPGLLQHRRLTAVRIWPLVIEWGPNGASVRAGLRSVDGRLGSVAWSPGSNIRAAWADRMMLAGGPLANVLLAVILFVGASMWPVQPPASAVPTFLFLGAVLNAGLAVLNLVPLKLLASLNTDGWKIVATFGGGHPSAAFIDSVVGLALHRRPRDWRISVAELEQRAAVSGTPEASRAWLLLLAASVALDLGDREEAERLLALGRSTPGASGDVRREIGLQRALIASLLANDPITARTELAPAADLMPPDGYDALALAAVLLAEAKRGEAAEALARWRRNAAASPIWEAGNQWALDRLDAALARQAPAEPSSLPA